MSSIIQRLRIQLQNLLMMLLPLAAVMVPRGALSLSDYAPVLLFIRRFVWGGV
jgi:hypothetical protein